ncbi:MAG: hypothetical protein ACM3ZE_01390, partial [Myxococcales bacterium]
LNGNGTAADVRCASACATPGTLTWAILAAARGLQRPQEALAQIIKSIKVIAMSFVLEAIELTSRDGVPGMSPWGVRTNPTGTPG